MFRLSIIEWRYLLSRCRFVASGQQCKRACEDLNHHKKPAMPPRSREVRMGIWTRFRGTGRLIAHLVIFCVPNISFAFRVSPIFLSGIPVVSKPVSFLATISIGSLFHLPSIKIKKTIMSGTNRNDYSTHVLPSTETSMATPPNSGGIARLHPALQEFNWRQQLLKLKY